MNLAADMKLWVIRNGFSNLVVARGFTALTVWPFVFVRTDAEPTRQLLTHEEIHARQQQELLLLPFFVWYGAEWLVRLCIDRHTAYRNIAFEREAYRNDLNWDYLRKRKPYAWLKLLGKKGGGK